MAKRNWLYNYRKIEGIQRSLTGLSKRSNYSNNMHQAYIILKEKEHELQNDFNTFYPELECFVKNEIKKTIEKNRFGGYYKTKVRFIN